MGIPSFSKQLLSFPTFLIMSIFIFQKAAGEILEDIPDFAEFANSKGLTLFCKDGISDQYRAKWMTMDNKLVTNITNIRTITADGSLIMHPFLADQFRPDVHITTLRCFLTNSVGTLKSRDVHLKAVVQQLYEIQVYDTYSIEGNTALFACHIPPVIGDYVKVVAWIKDDNFLIQPKENIAFSEKFVMMPNGNLHIRDVLQSEGGAKYKCKTLNQLTNETQISSTGQLFVTESQGHVAPRILDSSSSIDVAEGKTAILPCAVQGNPIPNLIWYIKSAVNQDLQRIPKNERFVATKSFLIIQNVQLSDEAIYVCEAESKLGKETIAANLTISGKISVSLQPKQHKVKIGDSVRFYCEISSHPTESIAWLHNGVIIVSQFTKNYVINDVKFNDKGIYQCFVKRGEKTYSSAASLILTEMPPQILESFEPSQLEPGTWTSIKCLATGIPLPTINWTLDEMILNQNNNGLFKIVNKIDQDGQALSTLTFKSLRTNDGGLYACTAISETGKAKHSARINVNGPIGTRKMPNKIAVSGEDTILNCPFYGYPWTTIEWLKNDDLLPMNLRQSVFENGTLLINKIHRSHDNGRYFCAVKNEKIGSNVKGYIDVQVMVSPKIVPFEFQADLLREGMRARLQCVVSEGDLPLSINWLKDGKDMSSSTGLIIRNLDDYSSILTIGSISPAHNGNYTCIASNKAATVIHNAQLSVNVPPAWKVIPQSLSTIQGETASLHCQADGFPEPKVTWVRRKGSGPLTTLTTDDKISILKNGTLTIYQSDYLTSGSYYCQVSNGIGVDLSTVVTIKVYVPPKFVKHSQVLYAKPLQNFKFQCVCKGDAPLEITWLKENHQLKIDSPKYKFSSLNNSNETTFEMTLLNVTRKDNGTYYCVAKNDHGVEKSTLTFLVQERPDEPFDVQVIKTNGREISLAWRAPFNGNLAIDIYIIKYFKNDKITATKESKTISGNQTVANITELLPATTYSFEIFAQNKEGLSDGSKIITLTTEEENPSGKPQNIHIENINFETIKVFWKPPEESTWNGRLLGYNIGFKEIDNSEFYAFKTLLTANPTAENLFVQIGGMKQQTKYSVVVQAYNNKGKGPLSEPVMVMTSEGAPKEAPMDVRCTTLTSTSIHVTWVSPSTESINGILKGYKLLYKPTFDWFDETSLRDNKTTMTSITLTNLQKFVNYTIHVLAYTKTGDGPQSDAVYCATLDDVPEAIDDIKVVPASTESIIISWNPPKEPNGILSSYTVYWKNVDHQKNIFSQSLPISQTYYEVTSLRKNHNYQFWVTASTLLGEGKSSKKVFQTTGSRTIPARIISFESNFTPTWKNEINLMCLSVGKPEVVRKWMFNGRAIETTPIISSLSDGSLHLKDLTEENSGNYSCHIHNELGEDKITHYLTVLAPPLVPTIEVQQTTSNSIEIRWKIAEVKLAKIKGFIIYLKKEDNEVKKIAIDSKERNYKFSGLECGSQYEISITAFNKIGTSEISKSIFVSTNGSVPSPPNKSDLIEESIDAVSLYLNTWKSNGCPIQHYVVEYAQRSSKDWNVVSKNLKPEQRRLMIPGLLSATWYTLRMTAHNMAGSSVVEFNFATLSKLGEIIPSDSNESNEINGLWSFLNFYIVIPISLTVLVLIIIFAISCYYVRKSNNQQQNIYGNQYENDFRREFDGNTLKYNQQRNNEFDEDPTPYATCQLSAHPPPLPPPNASFFQNVPLTTRRSEIENVNLFQGFQPQFFALHPNSFQNGQEQQLMQTSSFMPIQILDEKQQAII